jgi:dipeptidyl aminopeptidase/acylaminoacyl peptidase
MTLRLFGCADRLFYMPVREALMTPPNAIEVTFESDGRTLHGWFFPAPGVTADNPGPAVVHCHGNAGNMRDHAAFASFLPAAASRCSCSTTAGTGRASAARSRREGLVDDTLAAVRARSDHCPMVDPARVGLYGVSLGGTDRDRSGRA